DKTLSLGFEGHHFIAGLASHFRDLMVCQYPQTLDLLEVGEDVRELYREQSKKTSRGFLLAAIEGANECDLQYKISKNQRLLVELTLMKLASITFDGEKKKSDSLIPASHFTKGVTPRNGNGTAVQKKENPIGEAVADQKLPPRAEPSPPELEKKPEPMPQGNAQPDSRPKIEIKVPEKRVSGLSLSSLKVKMAHEG